LSPAARLELAPSPALAGAILFAHAAAAAALWICAPGGVGIALGLAVIALGAALAWRRALLRSPRSVRAIELDGERLRCHFADGTSLAAAAPKRRYVSRHLVIVPLGRLLDPTLLVTADMLGAREFRRLRLWSLWGRLPSRVAPKQLPA